MILLRLFFEFFKVGLFSIGGGMATVPFLLDLSDKTGWFTHAELADMIAVSESTPGPIGINMSTYVGVHTAGIAGGLTATLGLVLPSLIVIAIVYYLLSHFNRYESVQFVLKILRAAVIGLISYAFISVAKICMFNNSTVDYVSVIIFALLTVCVFTFKKIHPLVWILAGALLGILFL